MSTGPKGRTTLASILSATPVSAPVAKLEAMPVDTEDVIDAFADGSKSFGDRKRYFDELRRRDREMGREALTNLCRSYEQSGSKDLLAFICFLLDYGKLDIFEKFEGVLSLHNAKHPETRNYWLAILRDYSQENPSTRPSTALFLDMLRYLMEGAFEDRVVEFIKWFCHSSGTPTPFIYRTIVSIHRESTAPDDPNFDPPRRAGKEYVDCLYGTFFHGPIDDQHRILCSQYLLNNKLETAHVEGVLLAIAQDTTKAHNMRADAADTLLKLGNPELRVQTMPILGELGRDLTQLPTLTANKENVHAFDPSVTQFLLELGGLRLATIVKDGREQVRSFDDIVELIRALPRYGTEPDKINASLLRIRIDQILYPGSQTLTTIFLRIWQTIEKHVDRELLVDRLLDELIDMAETCSTGHANRLVNVFSGIDGFLLRMNWRDQIQSNIAGRLTARAKTAVDWETRSKMAEKGIQPSQERLAAIDAEFRELILAEMLNPEMEDRSHYTQWLRYLIAPLREELSREFVATGHVQPDDFDLYFRQGMLFFETGKRE